MIRQRKERRHALAGDGPIVGRARAALRRVAEQFGEVTSTDRTTVTVRTPEGLVLELSYDPGNYVFSRVYNLTIRAALPASSRVPGGITVSHRDRGGPRFEGAQAGSRTLDALNREFGAQLGGIDLLRGEVAGAGNDRSVTLTPLGGSFVWVLLPPVFHATAFPAGEPQRIRTLIAALADWEPREAAAPAAAG